jgi:hypothetical protein
VDEIELILEWSANRAKQNFKKATAIASSCALLTTEKLKQEEKLKRAPQLR